MSQEKTFWDVRKSITCKSTIDSEMVEGSYDKLNRIVGLFEGMTFKDLFSLQIRDLLSNFTANIASAVNEGLFDHEAISEERVNKLPMDATIADCYMTSEGEMLQNGIQLFNEFMGYEFIRIIPRGDADLLARRKNSIERLTAVAPDKTYKDIYMMTRRNASGGFIDAIAQARRSGVLADISNNLCCDNAYPVSSCFPVINKWCNSPTEGECSAGSDVCQ